MATSDWSVPTGKEILGTTYIKDTDNNIAATIEDLVDWCNNANGTYTDWTTTGLRTDFVDNSTAQTVAGVKTFSSSPIVPTPTTDYQASTKKYVDDNIALYGVSSGTYTPTVVASYGFTSVTNIEPCIYMRVGNIVTVNGMFNFIWNGSTTNSYIDLSLPVASAFTDNNEGFGVCSNDDYSSRTIISGFLNDAMRIGFNTPPSSGTSCFTFQYRVI